MIDRRRLTTRPNTRVLAAPGDDLTVVMLRFAASAVTLAVAVVLTLAS
jgi:hypothetical protein